MINILKSAVRLTARAALSVPVLPASGSGLMSNRRNPSSKVCAPADVAHNVTERLHSWINRAPSGGQSVIVRDKEGKVIGSMNRLP